MNVYEMYVANGNEAGFWVMSKDWRNVLAEVVTVAGRTSGEVEGEPPYFDNPPVMANFWTFVVDATEFAHWPDGSRTYLRKYGPRAGHWERAAPQRGKRARSLQPRELKYPGGYQYWMVTAPDLSALQWDPHVWKIHPLELADWRQRAERAEARKAKAMAEKPAAASLGKGGIEGRKRF